MEGGCSQTNQSWEGVGRGGRSAGGGGPARGVREADTASVRGSGQGTRRSESTPSRGVSAPEPGAQAAVCLPGLPRPSVLAHCTGLGATLPDPEPLKGDPVQLKVLSWVTALFWVVLAHAQTTMAVAEPGVPGVPGGAGRHREAWSSAPASMQRKLWGWGLAAHRT